MIESLFEQVQFSKYSVVSGYSSLLQAVVTIYNIESRI